MLRTRPTPTLFFSCRSRARKDRLRILGVRLLLRWRQGSAQGGGQSSPLPWAKAQEETDAHYIYARTCVFWMALKSLRVGPRRIKRWEANG